MADSSTIVATSPSIKRNAHLEVLIDSPSRYGKATKREREVTPTPLKRATALSSVLTPRTSPAPKKQKVREVSPMAKKSRKKAVSESSDEEEEEEVVPDAKKLLPPTKAKASKPVAGKKDKATGAISKAAKTVPTKRKAPSTETSESEAEASEAESVVPKKTTTKATTTSKAKATPVKKASPAPRKSAAKPKVKAETKSASESDEEGEHVTPKNKKGDKASTRKTIVKAKAKTEPKDSSESEEEEDTKPKTKKTKKGDEATPRKKPIVWTRVEEEAIGKVYTEAMMAVVAGHIKPDLEKVWKQEGISSKSSLDINNHLQKWRKTYKAATDTLASSAP